MLRNRALTGTLALMLGGSGCAGSYCAEPEHEQDAMCQLNLGGTVAAFTVSPNRIKINKDSTTQITINAYSALTNKLATLTQSGGMAKPLALGNVGSDGLLKATVRASDLASSGFVPGPAEVEIATQKRQVRIFVAPKFDSPTFSAVHSVAPDQGSGNMAAPAWVGVQANGTKKILTLNEYSIATISKQAIGEYIYDPINKNINKFSPLLFSAYNSTPYMDMAVRGIALSMTELVLPEYGNASTSLLTQCSLEGVCSGSTAAPYGSIASLTAAVDGQLFAGIFNARALAFSDAALANAINISSAPASVATPAFVTVGDANGDTHGDLFIWHRDGNVSVALSDSTGTSLAYDPKVSEALKALGLFGGAPPDAAAAGDIDQDGLDDLLIVKGSSLYVLSNLGASTFSAGEALAIPTQGPTGSAMLTPVSSIAIGDVGTDDLGLKDLVLASKTTRLIAVIENTATPR